MTPEDKRLVVALTLLGDRLPPIVDEVLAGAFGEAERSAFARVLATIAAELDPAIVVGESIPGEP